MGSRGHGSSVEAAVEAAAALGTADSECRLPINPEKLECHQGKDFIADHHTCYMHSYMQSVNILDTYRSGYFVMVYACVHTSIYLHKKAWVAAYLCQSARGPGKCSSEGWRLRSSAGKMGSMGGFSGFKSASACLLSLLSTCIPAVQSQGLPVLGHTCSSTAGCPENKGLPTVMLWNGLMSKRISLCLMCWVGDSGSTRRQGCV